MFINPDYRQSVSALIGLGGNIGDVAASMQNALNVLNSHDNCQVISVSKIYKTPPWGVSDQPWFLNACAEIRTSLDAETLLDLLLDIEKQTGRVRDKKWGPRTLDLDILAHGDALIKTDRLSIPHPRMAERAFVIIPLNDIAPERLIFGRSIKDYAAMVDRGDIELVDAELKII